MSEKRSDNEVSVSSDWRKINEKMLRSYERDPSSEAHVDALLNLPPEVLNDAIQTANSFATYYKSKLKGLDLEELNSTFSGLRQEGFKIPETPINSDEDRIKQINEAVRIMRNDPRNIQIPSSISDVTEYSDPEASYLDPNL